MKNTDITVPSAANSSAIELAINAGAAASIKAAEVKRGALEARFLRPIVLIACGSSLAGSILVSGRAYVAGREKEALLFSLFGLLFLAILLLWKKFQVHTLTKVTIAAYVLLALATMFVFGLRSSVAAMVVCTGAATAMVYGAQRSMLLLLSLGVAFFCIQFFYSPHGGFYPEARELTAAHWWVVLIVIFALACGISAWLGFMHSELQDSILSLEQAKTRLESQLERNATTLIALQRTERELKRTNAGLEDRVFARTVSLNEARLDAEEASRAKSEFLANVSHEIRTPLNAVMGMAELIRFEPVSDAVAGYANTITNSGAVLLDVVENILGFAKIEAGKVGVESIEFSPYDVLRDVSALAAVKSVDADIVVNFSTATNLPKLVLGDPLRVVQVLANVVNNAIKFTKQGTVTIETRCRELNHDEVQIEFTIQDTGIGMKPSQLEKIFEPFVQADSSATREYRGTGLGLAISRRLVLLMGGKIFAASEMGHGSTFTIVLPFKRVVTAADAPPQSPAAPAAPAFAGKRILVVEDDPINRKVAHKMLEKLGFSIEMANDGKQAVEMINQPGFSVDCVLMDLHMPVMNGMEAVAIIRKTHNTTALPIIAFTANAFTEQRNIALAGGFNDYITKPVHYDALIAALDRWAR
jgi:signal transduction histidine kinase/CheY-like chemotaxis protein